MAHGVRFWGIREASWAQFLQILRFRPPGEPQQFVCNGTALIQNRTALAPPNPLSVAGGGDSGSCRLQEGSLEKVTMVEELPIPQPLGRSSFLQQGHL